MFVCILLLIAAIHGWRRGFLVRAVQWVGLLVGAGLAYHFTPRLLARSDLLGAPSIGRGALLIVATLIGATLGRLVMQPVAARVARRVNSLWLDRLVGAIAAVLVYTFVIWFAITATAPVQGAGLAGQVADSRIMKAVDSQMPELPRRWASRLATSLNTSRFPDVFNGIEQIPDAGSTTPDAGATSTAGVKAAAGSIVRVLTDSTQCGDAEGSGWVVANHRVVTNAHVVAGSQEVVVQREGVGAKLRAQVVAFDPRVDLAILAVPDLDAKPLARTGALATGTSTAVAGFPLNGNYSVVPATVRGSVEATGRTIYANSTVTREIYVLTAEVRPGNSGGPLLTTSGKVAGTVFAKSTTSALTGYALTDSETSSLLTRAASLSQPVSTQACLTD